MNNTAKEIEKFPKEYPTMDGGVFSRRAKEILEGSPLKSHEGRMFGRMYADWKQRRGFKWV